MNKLRKLEKHGNWIAEFAIKLVLFDNGPAYPTVDKVFTSVTSYDNCFKRAKRCGLGGKLDNIIYGFVDKHGVFYEFDEALQLAKDVGQVSLSARKLTKEMLDRVDTIAGN